jgi:hypothetical protein
LDPSFGRMLPNWPEMTGFCVAGLVLWSTATVYLYRVTTLRFQAVIRRGTG